MSSQIELNLTNIILTELFVQNCRFKRNKQLDIKLEKKKKMA